MEENLMKMIEGYEDGIVCSHTSTGQSYDSTSSEQTLQQVPEVKETISDKVEDDDAEDCSAHTLQEPVEVFFQVLSQKFATSAVRVKELSDQNSGRLIGKVRDNGNIICLFPDPTLEVNVALQKLMDSNMVFMLKGGLKVYIVDTKIFSGKVKIRPAGQTVEVWTLIEAVGK